MPTLNNAKYVMTAKELIKQYNEGRRDFCGANLIGANLYGANLTGANLYGANLYGAEVLDFS